MNNKRWIGYAVTVLALAAAPITAPAARSCAFTQVGFGSAPSISADGARIAFVSSYAFVSNHEIYYRSGISLLDVNTSTLTQVVDNSIGVSPYWNPDPIPFLSGDGTRIAFHTRNNLTGDNPEGHVEVFLFDTRTGVLTQITNTTVDYKLGFATVRAINGDGTRIVFDSDVEVSGYNKNGNVDIFLYSTTTRSFMPVTDTGKSGNSNPSITADGALLRLE